MAVTRRVALRASLAGGADATPDGGGDFVDACVRANAVHIADRLREDGDLRGLVGPGSLDIVPVRYALATSEAVWI